MDNNNWINVKQYKRIKPWSDYNLGTKVYAIMGGYWELIESGYKWCNGATFPTPGGDWSYIVEPPNPSAQKAE